MEPLREWAMRLVRVFRKRGAESEELQQEIRFHLEMEAEENLRRGMPRQEAERQARIRLGGVAQLKEAYDEQRGLPVIEEFGKDVRYGLRMLWRSPGFTAVAVLSLGLGIGASSSIFSVVDAVLIRKLPVKEPGRLVFLGSHRRGLREGDVPTAELFSYPRYRDLRSASDSFEGLAAFGSFDWGVYVREPGDGGSSPDPATARLVTGNYFEVLGLRPWLGRLLGPGDDRSRGGHPVTVLSHGYWKRRFGSDPHAMGKSLLINGEPFTVVGVTPPEFLGETVGSSTDFWIPMAMQRTMRRDDLLDDRDTSFLLLIGRLKKGASLGNAEAEATAAFRRILTSEVGEASEPILRAVDRIRVEAIPGDRGLSGFRRRYGDALLLLMAVIMLVLLIACANVANLLLARAETRRSEMSVRVSLGAGRARLMRQLLTESLVLGLAGGVLGFVLAAWGSRVLLAMASVGSGVVPLDVSLDHRVLGFTLVVCVLTAGVFGLVPALRATRADGATPLGSHSPRVIGSGFGLSKALVVSQVALSLLLLASAVLFLRSLESLREADLGFRPENLMAVEIDPEGVGLTREEATALYSRIQERLEAVAGVKSAALSLRPLLSGARRRDGIEIDGSRFRRANPPRSTRLWSCRDTSGPFA